MKTIDKTNKAYTKNLVFTVRVLFVLFIIVSFSSCEKYLDEKTDISLILPETMEDCQLLLNYFDQMNEGGPDIQVTAADNFTIPVADFDGWTSTRKVHYVWDANAVTHWNFTTVLTANTVLEILEGITPENAVEQATWNQLKGAALFFRSFSFYKLLEVFTLPYNEATADTDLGIPLRLTSDVNVVTLRSSLQESYDHIINALLESIDLMVDTEHQSQPSKAAAYALLSRVYLSMGNYPLALQNASNALNIQDELLDYNEVLANPSGSEIFPIYGNAEVIFQHRVDAAIGFAYAPGYVADDLYNTYAADDLRPDLYFMDIGNGPQMWGNYSGSYYRTFDGLAVDELYLTRAECYARNNQLELAFTDLNALLEKRYTTGTFTPYASADFTSVTATQLILQERRKELINRGIRWMDIRRLNTENDPNFAVGTLSKVDGQYTLPPGDLRYAFLIPEASIEIFGLQQNPR